MLLTFDSAPFFCVYPVYVRRHINLRYMCAVLCCAVLCCALTCKFFYKSLMMAGKDRNM